MYIYLKRIVDLGNVLWRKIIDLYLKNPYDHIYLVYDLLYEWSNIDVVIDYDLAIKSYRLYWKGPYFDSIILWSNDICPDVEEMISKDLLDKLRPDSVIHLLNISDRRCIDKIVEYFEKNNWVVDKAVFYDMVVDEENFKPYEPDQAHRLTLDDLDAFIEIKKHQFREYEYSVEVNRESAIKLLRKRRYYGVFVDSELVAIACRYVGLPEIGVVGDVYVHPDHRGRGYGKIVTSAITRDVVGYGAKALLHVMKTNEVAIRLYEKLGYKIIGEKTWLFLEEKKEK